MSTAEHTETMRALELVAFRRLGSTRVHFALVMPDAQRPGSVLGCPVAVIDAPTSAFCSRILRGRKLVIPRDDLPSHTRNGRVCKECRLTAQLTVEKARSNG